jgi:hypothetical protein
MKGLGARASLDRVAAFARPSQTRFAAESSDAFVIAAIGPALA